MGMAQLSEPALEARSEQNVERFILSTDDKDIGTFIKENMAPMSSEEESKMVQQLKKTRSELKPFLEGIGIDMMDNALIFNLSSSKGQRSLVVTLDHAKDVITRMEIRNTEKGMDITLENIRETFVQLEKEGFSGLVHLRIKGDIVMEEGFGMANKALHLKNDANTIFGIGSRPIDFTIAGIFLLRQKGLLRLEDTIGKYIDHVPSDKSAMTIMHLLTGKSGLPDFFHTDDDWDADLRYIDRNEAVRRLLAQKLLFEPGKQERHSHAAFGFLAALIEIVSGEPYYAFIRKNFLDPANMNRTGEYGESRGLRTSDFAVGHGPSSVGVPNIPPNWGKTSWLVKGSGGMYSTLNDLLQFYRFIRSGQVLNEKNNMAFKNTTVNIDGSERGFELFNAYFPSDTEIFLFLNKQGDREKTKELLRSLEGLVMKHK